MVLEPVVRPVVNPVARAIQGSMNGVFSPAILFTTGEQGAWYDPSDLTTLFQGSAGTTPVTAVEQPVGLVLDKSKGLVLGSELVTNGGPGFTTTTGWTTTSATVTASGGKLVCTKSGAGGAVYWTLTTSIGTWYKVDIVWENVDATAPSVLVNSSGGLSITTTNTTATIYFLAVATTTFVQMQTGSGAVGTSTRIISLSTKTISGNHAYQTTSASRPTLRARYNLLTYSEQFSNAAWNIQTNLTFTTGVTDPNGGATATTLKAVVGSGRLLQQAAVLNSVQYTASVWIRRRTGTGDINWEAAGVGVGPLINVTTTWQRFTYTASVGGGNIFYYGIRIATVGDEIDIWGAQLVSTAVFPSNTYQRIAAATDYAAAGFPPYLFFDGVDDSLLTNSVDFSATDKMTVWAGVTKSSDAQSIINELSSSIANAGSYALTGADLSSVGAKYGFYLNGTAISGFSASTYTAPTTNVLSVAYDIAGAGRATEIYPRINGVIPTLTGVDSASAGTGNFANAPLYIGRRNNASLPLNGNIYSLIIRGAQSTAAQVSSTESWVAAKTPLGSL